MRAPFIAIGIVVVMPEPSCCSPCDGCPIRPVCPLREQIEHAQREGGTVRLRYTREG